jgi:hypothetical protein
MSSWRSRLLVKEQEALSSADNVVEQHNWNCGGARFEYHEVKQLKYWEVNRY